MELVRALLDVVCPRVCVGCSDPAGGVEGHFCWDCFRELSTVVSPYCARCGDPVDGLVTGSYTCSLCLRRHIWFDRARSAVRYRGPMMKALQAFKYGRATWLARDFGALLEACVHTHWPSMPCDALAYIPLFHRKERERTYNQSRVLADDLGRRLKLPVYGTTLRRIRDTPTQTNLNTIGRAENIAGAFAVEHPGWIEGKSLLLVDDVMTTGATVNEAARVLKENGAARVFVVTVARG